MVKFPCWLTTSRWRNGNWISYASLPYCSRYPPLKSKERKKKKKKEKKAIQALGRMQLFLPKRINKVIRAFNFVRHSNPFPTYVESTVHLQKVSLELPSNGKKEIYKRRLLKTLNCAEALSGFFELQWWLFRKDTVSLVIVFPIWHFETTSLSKKRLNTLYISDLPTLVLTRKKN